MKDIIIIPVGSHEHHGPHLPLETDYLIAKQLCQDVGRDFNAEIDEGISVGHSPEHLDFSGTISIEEDSFITLIIEKFLAHNDKKLRILINAHGGNSEILNNLKNGLTSTCVIFDLFQVAKKHMNDIRSSKLGGICHAGEFETSLMLHLFPDLVSLDKISPDQIKYVPNLDPFYEGPRPRDWKSFDLNPHGILGDSLQATKEKGEKWYNLIVEEIRSTIKILMK